MSRATRFVSDPGRGFCLSVFMGVSVGVSVSVYLEMYTSSLPYYNSTIHCTAPGGAYYCSNCSWLTSRILCAVSDQLLALSWFWLLLLVLTC